MHKNSIGIEVCNFGYVVNGKTYAGATVEESQIVELSKPFRGHNYGIAIQINKLKFLSNGFYGLLKEIISM
jgi:hypothetical protein